MSSVARVERPTKVLVVEDEPGLRFILSEALVHQYDFIVVEASTADQALEVLEQDAEINCVFTDVRMPGSLDGIALSKHVLREHPEIKVVITSGHLSRGDAIENVPFMPKPYNLTEVGALIQKLVSNFGSTRKAE